MARFWNTDISNSGSSYHETFFRQVSRPPGPELAQIGGRRLSSDNQKVVYQFAVPAQAEVYLKPTLAKQTVFRNQQQKPISYKNLKSLRLKLPQRINAPERVLFETSSQVSQRIRITPYLQDAALFQLILDNSDEKADSERVIGSLEVFIVDSPVDEGLPALPLLMLFWVVPVILAWLCNAVLSISLAGSLGLAVTASLLSHIAWLLKPEWVLLVMPAGVVTSLILLTIHIWLEKKPVPSAPFFWGILLIAVTLRWQEILIQAAVPLEKLPQSMQYYNHALVMDLFSPKGFFAALFPQGPLYPFLIKLTGFAFGFSPFHLFYVSLLAGLLLLALSYRLAYLLLKSRPQALLVMLILAINPLLVQESGLRSPDMISACLGLTLLLLVFSTLQHAGARGILRGGLLVLLIWTHLSFFPLALLLLGVDMLYQVKRSQATSTWSQSLKAGLLSLMLVLVGFFPCLIQNNRAYGSYFPESTAYVSRVANLEFSDREGFPASLDVIRLGDKALHYRQLGIREYFLDFHGLPELLTGSALGFCMLALDGIGSLLMLASGENILSVLIHGIASQENLLPILMMFLLEIFGLLFLIVFAWLRFRRYRFLLLVLALLILPHAFFYGVFMLKGYSLLQHLLDQQVFLFGLPILAIMAVDAIIWMQRNQHRLLR